MMDKTFQGFYMPSEEDFDIIWKNSIFVFDTNVLLNIYRYPQKTSETLISILENISDKIWLPYQVGLEYSFKYEDEISSQNATYDRLNESLEKELNKIKNNLDNYKRHSNLKTGEISAEIENAKVSIQEKLEKQKKTHPEFNLIKENIRSLFRDKIGPKYTKEKLEEIYKNGEERYELKIPPGFEDAKKKESQTKYHDGILYRDKFGDLVLWKQLIERANKEGEETNIIFITDDSKSDWWRKSGANLVPHPELIHEFKRETDNKLFYMYNTETFIKNAFKYLSIPQQEQSDIDNAIQNIVEAKKQNDHYDIETRGFKPTKRAYMFSGKYRKLLTGKHENELLGISNFDEYKDEKEQDVCTSFEVKLLKSSEFSNDSLREELNKIGVGLGYIYLIRVNEKGNPVVELILISKSEKHIKDIALDFEKLNGLAVISIKEAKSFLL